MVYGTLNLQIFIYAAQKLPYGMFLKSANSDDTQLGFVLQNRFDSTRATSARHTS